MNDLLHDALLWIGGIIATLFTAMGLGWAANIQRRIDLLESKEVETVERLARIDERLHAAHQLNEQILAKLNEIAEKLR